MRTSILRTNEDNIAYSLNFVFLLDFPTLPTSNFHQKNKAYFIFIPKNIHFYTQVNKFESNNEKIRLHTKYRHSHFAPSQVPNGGLRNPVPLVTSSAKTHPPTEHSAGNFILVRHFSYTCISIQENGESTVRLRVFYIYNT